MICQEDFMKFAKNLANCGFDFYDKNWNLINIKLAIPERNIKTFNFGIPGTNYFNASIFDGQLCINLYPRFEEKSLENTLLKLNPKMRDIYLLNLNFFEYIYSKQDLDELWPLSGLNECPELIY